MGRIISYTIFGVMLAAALSYMVYDNIRYAGTSSWQSVPGRIVESEYYLVGGGSDADRNYHVRVAYDYVVEGRRFTGSEIWLTAGMFFDTAEDADAFLIPYRVGNQVTVFHDPANPDDAALIVERGGDPMVMLILAGLWGLIGTYHYPRDGQADGGEASQAAGQPTIAGEVVGAPRTRGSWKVALAQMAVATFLVIAAFIAYVLVLGPGLERPPS